MLRRTASMQILARREVLRDGPHGHPVAPSPIPTAVGLFDAASSSREVSACTMAACVRFERSRRPSTFSPEPPVAVTGDLIHARRESFKNANVRQARLVPAAVRRGGGEHFSLPSDAKGLRRPVSCLPSRQAFVAGGAAGAVAPVIFAFCFRPIV